MEAYQLDSRTQEDNLSVLKDFIIEDNHPCVMAQTVFSQDSVSYYEYDYIENSDNDSKILENLKEYINDYNFQSKKFQTFIVTFRNSFFDEEIDFERELWLFLKRLKKHDKEAWDSSVSKDIHSPKFSYSVLGKAFYIIGMHPNSSRTARQTDKVTIVFNLHHQFEILRDMNAYNTVRNRIRKRDKEMNGSINPMLRDFGTSSEALQYSGRETKSIAGCPFGFDKI